MRRLLFWLLLLGAAATLWYGARWFRQSRSLEATLVFDRSQPLQAGVPVVFGEEIIGKVVRITKLERKQAVVIAVNRERRNQVRTDSLFTVTRAKGRRQLVVSSRFAIGGPLEDGAVVHVKDRAVARMLDRTAERIVPLAVELSDRTIETLKTYDRRKLEQQFDSWSASVPEWKRQGSVVVDRNVARIRAQVDKAEADLRKASRDVDADRLRARWNEWLESFNGDPVGEASESR